ncbi:hypothetical protein EBT16_02475 [bacterium]|nr:hypothetical protein [bacterium]
MDSNYKSGTWTINNTDSKYTWENSWAKINNISTNTPPYITVASTIDFVEQTEDSMMEDILSRTEDQGFLRDLVEWLRSEAPKKLKRTLKELVAPMHTGAVTYERLCEVVYQVGFRTSELIERRMILGPSNNWVAEYFKDFPPGSRSSE